MSTSNKNKQNLQNYKSSKYKGGDENRPECMQDVYVGNSTCSTLDDLLNLLKALMLKTMRFQQSIYFTLFFKILIC